MRRLMLAHSIPAPADSSCSGCEGFRQPADTTTLPCWHQPAVFATSCLLPQHRIGIGHAPDPALLEGVRTNIEEAQEQLAGDHQEPLPHWKWLQHHPEPHQQNGVQDQPQWDKRYPVCSASASQRKHRQHFWHSLHSSKGNSNAQKGGIRSCWLSKCLLVIEHAGCTEAVQDRTLTDAKL